MKSLEYFHTPGLFWFRLFGYGLHFKDIKRHPLLFSERQKPIVTYKTVVGDGWWKVKILTPERSH